MKACPDLDRLCERQSKCHRKSAPEGWVCYSRFVTPMGYTGHRYLSKAFCAFRNPMENRKGLLRDKGVLGLGCSLAMCSPALLSSRIYRSCCYLFSSTWRKSESESPGLWKRPRRNIWISSPIPGPAHDSMFPMPSASSCVSCPAASEKVVYSEAHKELILHLVLECSRAFDWKIIPR